MKLEVQKMLCYVYKSFLNIYTLYGRCFFVGNVIVSLSPLLNVAVVDLALFHSVALVANQEEWESFGVLRASFCLEITLPLVKALEALRVRNIIDQDASIGAAVKCYSQTLIPFLSCCVPNL
jgi:hypothetical protein